MALTTPPTWHAYLNEPNYTNSSSHGQIVDDLVLFVPGIMGSVLRRQGTNEFGHLANEVIWGDELALNLDTLSRVPNRLRARNVVAERVIHEMRVLSGKRIKVYEPLISYCTSSIGLGLKEGANFYPFAYDWRRNILEAAQDLVDFIHQIDPDKVRGLRLICHSMGGLLCRAALHLDAALAKRTRRLFQIASPVLGAPKAFLTLQEYPELNPFLDSLLLMKHYLNPRKRAELVLALQGCVSVFQLLPPASELILEGPNGSRFPASETAAWPQQAAASLAAAALLPPYLELAPGIDLFCVYGGDSDTYERFVVDDSWSVRAREKSPSGDGTVLSRSARAKSIEGRTLRIRCDDVEHTSICGHAETLAALKAHFS